MISPNEPMSIDPVNMTDEKRQALSASLKRLKGETPWEDVLLRRAEAQLLDLAMEQVRNRRSRERIAARRDELTEELAELKAEKSAIFARINDAVAKVGRTG